MYVQASGTLIYDVATMPTLGHRNKQTFLPAHVFEVKTRKCGHAYIPLMGKTDNHKLQQIIRHRENSIHFCTLQESQ